MWPILKRAAFILWNNSTTIFSCQSLTFSLDITLINSGAFLYSETGTDLTITASNPVRSNGVLTICVDRASNGQDCLLSNDMNVLKTIITLIIPTDPEFLGASVNVACKKQNINE